MKSIYLLLGLLFSLPTWADYELVLELNDAQEEHYLFRDEPVMTFGEAGEVTVSSNNGVDLDLTMADIVRFYVRVSGDSDGITPMVDDGVFTFSCQDGVVSMTGVKGGSAYSLSGVLVSQGAVQDGGAVTIDLRDVPSGVYIIKTNNKSIKIRKQ